MPDLSLDFRFLRYAQHAAAYGSFRRAAADLGISQSTLSRRVQMLEHRLGFPIFERSREGVRLSPAGALFIREAVVGAKQLAQAARTAAATHRGDCGDLRIGIIAGLNDGHLRDAILEFRQKHSKVRLRILEGSIRDLAQALLLGTADIVVAFDWPELKGYQSVELWQESLFAVLPASHPLASRQTVDLRDLSTDTFLISAGGPGSAVENYLIRSFRDPKRKPILETHEVSRESLFNLVSMGYGITLTLSSSVRPDDNNLVFRMLLGEKNTVRSSAVHAEGNSDANLANFISVARAIRHPARG